MKRADVYRFHKACMTELYLSTSGALDSSQREGVGERQETCLLQFRKNEGDFMALCKEEEHYGRSAFAETSNGSHACSEARGTTD